MNSVLLDIIVKGRGFHIPRYPQLILGDSKKYLQGDILDANAVVTEIDKSVTKLIDAAPDTLNTLKEIADSLHGDADIAGTLISRITDVENSVADLAGLQSTDILELTSRLGDVETKSAKNAQDIANIQTNKVDVISGKQLSTEDYTTAEKTKLAGIEAGALVNPTNVSVFTNDAGYLTEHQSLADYATLAWVNSKGFITEHQDISGKANIADLATVATSGSYNDLTNKPDFDSMLNNAGFVTQADFEDAVGIDTEGLQELKAILSDDDTTTGLLNVLDQKVEKVTGKLLSTEDYTTAEKTKLAGIEEGAQVNPTNVSELTNDAGYLVEDDMYNINIDANGHEYVDLGLPSGTLWATMNVGAQSETDYGLYFQWGDTQGYTADQVGNAEGKKAFSWADYKWTEDGGSTFIKYDGTDGKIILDLEDDAARANWGGEWHMPTTAQWEELFNTEYVTNQWTTVNGVNGYLLTSRSNSKTLFIPATNGMAKEGRMTGLIRDGYVWSSSLNSSDVTTGRSLCFNDAFFGVYYGDRFSGRIVRGVLSSSKAPKYASKQELDAVVSDVSDLKTPFDANGHEYVDLDLPSGTLWATMNVGATKPTEVGGYYVYGNGANLHAVGQRFPTPSSGSNPTYYLLTPETDTATSVWGGSWETPSPKLISELNNNTTISWITSEDGVSCMKFASKKDDSKYILIPAGGFSTRNGISTVGATDTDMVWMMTSYFSKQAENDVNETPLILTSSNPGDGYNVRPIIANPVLKCFAEVAFTGNYDDLDNRPIIPAEQIQADWNLTANLKKDYIKNKPDVAVRADVYTYREGDISEYTWGGGWHVPTREQWEELLDNCKITFVRYYAGSMESTGIKLVNKTDSSKYIVLTENSGIFYFWVRSDQKLAIKFNKSLFSIETSVSFDTDSITTAQVWPVLDSTDKDANGHEYVDFGLPSGTLWSTNYIASIGKIVFSNLVKQIFDLPKFAPASAENRLTDISGQSTNTYTPRVVEDGQTSLISNATNIQDALNKLDDALVELLAWKEYNAAPVAQNAFYRIGSVPGYASLVNLNGETIIVNDTLFVLDVNANSWSTYSATDGELAGTLREEFGTQTYDAGGDTISGGRTEFEINGETIVYNGGVFTPAISEWSAVGADELG